MNIGNETVKRKCGQIADLVYPKWPLLKKVVLQLFFYFYFTTTK